MSANRATGTQNKRSNGKPTRQDRVNTVASVEAFLKPRSVAVIGAGRKQGTIGNKIFRNLLQAEFAGVAYPVNPNAGVVAAVKAYPTILDIPGEVDLAVVVVPAALVQDVVEQCGKKKVKGVIVISAGFGEAGPEGKERQARLVRTCHQYGMRLIGPNCMGIINTALDLRLNATFSAVYPPEGNIAFGTQSGALGLAILEYARNLNIGLSTFVSVGNRADVSSNDLLEFWKDDPATSVILLYLESFGNLKKFARLAPTVTTRKPVVAVKSGRTLAGSRAAASHTGAMATSEAISDVLFSQVGVIRVDTMEELFDVANLLAHQPIPAGRRVAILTNGGGPGILTADACASRGLEVPSLSEKTTSEMKRLLLPEASVANPVDMTAQASAEQYSHSLRLLAEDESTDTVIVIFIPPIGTELQAVAAAISEHAPEFRRRGKTLVASFMGTKGAPVELGSNQECCVPSFSFPEATATAVARACEYSDWLKRPKGTVPELTDVNKKKAMQIIDTALKQNPVRPLWLDALSTVALLDCYGINVVKTQAAATADEAAKAAAEVGFPVAVKLLSATVAHKTDVGGVVLDLNSVREVKQAFSEIRDRLAVMGKQAEMQGVTVQKMVTDGIEVIVGVSRDPSLGPIIMFGIGGIYAELFKDVAFRIHPLTDVDARELVRSVKARQLLEGWRGSAPSDMKALEDLLIRVSKMVEDLPQITELDLNPVKVREQGSGYVVVDTRVLLG